MHSEFEVALCVYDTLIFKLSYTHNETSHSECDCQKNIAKHQIMKVSPAGLSVLRLFRIVLVLGRIDARLVFLSAPRALVGGL